mmetsp:Transcript_12472/g.41069  ORF Transcript_12472/g.41069 Transcript_12472/m.41069 type:complete len:246 (+) Transcript_12472:3-740(+)
MASAVAATTVPAGLAGSAADIKATARELELLLGSAEAAMEEWAAAKLEQARETKREHVRRMTEADEAYQTLVAKERTAKAEAAEQDRRRERERAELEALQEDAEQAREVGEVLPEQVGQLQAAVASAQAAVDRKRGSLDAAEQESAEKLGALREALEVYEHRFGLSFEFPDDGVMRVTFVRVDAADPERAFTFAVRVSGEDDYELVECAPALAEAGELVEALNAGKDFSGAVQAFRKAFKASTRA